MIPLWSIPIATENTIVVKPSKRYPSAVLIMAELAKKAGFPKGVISIVHGTTETVNFILDEPRIKAVSFVGSTSAGEYVYTTASANGKRCMANLGAKNHAVLFPDCDRDAAENAIIGAAFGAARQRCTALSSLITLPETETWVESLDHKARVLRVDGGFEPDVDVGPVNSPESKSRIEQLIDSAEQEGASIVLDGREYTVERPSSFSAMLTRKFTQGVTNPPSFRMVTG